MYRISNRASYWSRRQVLRGAALGGAGVAAAALVACGDKEGRPETDVQQRASEPEGLISRTEDSSRQAQRGGVLKDSVNADVTTFDPLTVVSLVGSFVPFHAYAGLVRRKTTPVERSMEVEGDLAASWEIPGEGREIIMKLRPGVTFDPRDPTNGRPLDSEDIVFTWKRSEALSRQRTDYANSANPDAPIETMEAIDNNTIRIKLARPDADVLNLLLWIDVMPREADGKFDPKALVRGSAAWMISEYRPSVSWELSRNPGYWEKERPYVDKVELPIIPEYAAGLAQFKAGNLYTYQVRLEDILATKRDVPALELYQNPLVAQSNSFVVGGWLEGSPFRDIRVRQALRMAIDIESFNIAFYNVDRFQKDGLPIETYVNSGHMTKAHGEWWLNSESNEFGPNAKYLKYDPAEAKKLLAAAGYSNGLEVPALYFTTPQYGALFPRYIEAALGMYREVGIRTKPEVLQYSPEWLDKVFNGRGKFAGISFSTRANANPALELVYMYLPSGSRFYGFDVNGRDPENGDPTLAEMIRRQKREFNSAERTKQLHEIQRYIAEKQYYPQFVPTVATGFTLAWPALRNVHALYDGTIFEHGADWKHYWLDATKPPLRR